MEVDGKLVQECKQSDFNPVCFRKAQLSKPEERLEDRGAHARVVASPEHVDVPATVDAAQQAGVKQ
jgi:hypothetical protein